MDTCRSAPKISSSEADAHELDVAEDLVLAFAAGDVDLHDVAFGDLIENIGLGHETQAAHRAPQELGRIPQALPLGVHGGEDIQLRSKRLKHAVLNLLEASG